MDNDYKYIKLLTLTEGWVSMNTEHIESVRRISGKYSGIEIGMISGRIHLIHLQSQINRLQKIISTKI